ncbi:conserved domain protein [Ruminococcus albus 8]|uniref:Conserved domain protein n=1 Tax=Ruminococcus albus 8 TaxID=246199 RepID=E9SCD1_RUMAL|nr:conserved domain protein [Ruminococcus albus 8]
MRSFLYLSGSDLSVHIHIKLCGHHTKSTPTNAVCLSIKLLTHLFRPLQVT